MTYICIVLVGASYIAFYLYRRYVIRESVFLIIFLLFLLGFAGKLNTKLTEADHIHIGKHYGSMSLASTEIRNLFQGKACGIAGCGTHGKGNQDLINVKTWIFASKIFGLQLLDRMYGIRLSLIHI